MTYGNPIHNFSNREHQVLKGRNTSAQGEALRLNDQRQIARKGVRLICAVTFRHCDFLDGMHAALELESKQTWD